MESVKINDSKSKLKPASASAQTITQPELSVGNINDPLEHEADAMADKIMCMPEPFIQRCACEEEKKVRLKPSGSFIQKKETGNGNQASNTVTQQIAATKGAGSSMPGASKDFMENRFGTDFSGVRIHSGGYASELSSQLNAQAFTVGNDIYFNQGKFSPESDEGKHLLAHELTHVVQQSSHIQRKTTTTPAPTTNKIKDGGLSSEELNRIALQLHRAMSGWGTDEESIYSALSGRSQEQVDAIARVYKSHYKSNLLSDLQDELNDSEMRHLAIFSPTAADRGNAAETSSRRAELIARQLRNAMSGWGTNEASIMAALTGRSEAERLEIKIAYKKLTGHELESDLSDELSGSELEKALKLLNKGILSPEEESIWSKLWRGIKSVAGGIWGGIKAVVGGIWTGIKAVAGWTWDVIKSAAALVWDLVTWLPSRAWALIKHIVMGVVGIGSWLWDITKVFTGDIGLAQWFLNGLWGGTAWVLRLVSKIADLAGVGEAWTFVMNIIKFNTRTLTDVEKTEAKKVYGGSISYWQVRIDEFSLISAIGSAFTGSPGMGVTTAHTINFDKRLHATPGSEDMHWLMHELGHVAQYTNVGLQYIGEAIHAQASSAKYEYNKGAGLVGKNLSDFNREQQASILADYYRPVLYPTGSPDDWMYTNYATEYARMRDQAVNGQF